jgi:hypothetical protein
VIRQTRTIGVVTGGGDSPGLNAVIRADVRTAKLQQGRRGVDRESDCVRAAVAVGITFGDQP